MAEKITIEAEEAPPAPPPPSDRLLDLALEVGEMRAERANNTRELMEVKSELSRACELIRNQNDLYQSLQSQTNRAEDRAETAQAVAVATAAEVAESNEEDEGALLEIAPPMETRIEIEQKPATSRGMLSKLIFGP